MASHKQQALANKQAAQQSNNNSELAMLNQRQKSREEGSKERAGGGHQSIAHEELYRRGSNVTHMPDVVTKVTQNSMSFATMATDVSKAHKQ